jgi:hypothetical protein
MSRQAHFQPCRDLSDRGKVMLERIADDPGADQRDDDRALLELLRERLIAVGHFSGVRKMTLTRRGRITVDQVLRP